MESADQFDTLTPFVERGGYMFTKKHYEKIAFVLKVARLKEDSNLMNSKNYMPYTIEDQWLEIRDAFIRQLKLTNPNFSEEKFITACEEEGGELK